MSLAAPTPLPVTVLMVNWAGSYGGAEQYQLNLVRGFDPARYRFIFASPAGEWPRRLAAAGYAHYEVPIRPGFDLQSVLRLRRIIRSEKVRIVHAQQSRSLLQAGLAARLVGGVAVVQTEHNMSMGWHRCGYYPWYVPLISHRLRRLVVHALADRLTVFAPSGRDFYVNIIHVPARKVVVIPSPYPLHPERPAPTNPYPIIGTPAELTERKGLSFLIDAAPRVLERYPGAQFLIMGRGHLEQRLRQQIAERNLQDGVHLLGFVPDASEQMPGWDLLALPSLWEPFGQVVLEAMSHGLPVVTTTGDGPESIVVDGETGLLVPPGEAPALAVAILRLLDDPDLAQRMGQAGRQRIATVYSLERIAKLMDALYQELLGLRP